jgi:hypothetical protein
MDYYNIPAKKDCKGNCFTYENFYDVLTHKISQGMSLDDAYTSINVTNGNMKKLKHSGCCLAKIIINMNNARIAIRDATP